LLHVLAGGAIRCEHRLPVVKLDQCDSTARPEYTDEGIDGSLAIAG
jgi:hypothetical protein